MSGRSRLLVLVLALLGGTAAGTDAGIGTRTGTGTGAVQRDPWVGRYEGRLEGMGEATIRSAGRGRYRADLGVGAPGCGGSVSGGGRVSGHRMTFTAPSETGPPCRIDLTRRGRRLQVREGPNCIPFHGAACGFTGTLTRRR